MSDIRLRRCTRCGHVECPCCRDFCDDDECINRDDSCGEYLECLYAEVPDFDGYAKLDATIEGLNCPTITPLPDGSGVEVQTRHKDRP